MANCWCVGNHISLEATSSSSSRRRAERILSPSLLSSRRCSSPCDKGRAVGSTLSLQNKKVKWRRTPQWLLPPLRATSQAQQEEKRNDDNVAVKKNARQAKDDLLDLIRNEERGVRTLSNPRRLDEIIRAIGTLASLGTDMVTTDESLTAPWRMIWTTEKETLFLIEKAPIFGTRAGDVLQIIDVASGTLNNEVLFPPTGAFRVNATIKAASSQRVNFKFVAASLKIGRWNIPIPPFGRGWFESVYLDDEIRISKDIRDNYLICDRSPLVPVL